MSRAREIAELGQSLTVDSSGDLTLSSDLTATSFTGDGSALTNLPATGGSITATATGALADGDLVVLRTDGNVEVISGSKQTMGSRNKFADGNGFCVSTYDSVNDKVVILYEDDGDDDIYAIAGTVSGTTITFGTPVEVTGANVITLDCSFDEVREVVVAVYGDTYNGYARTIDVSGASISLGTQYQFNTGDTDAIQISYDANADKHLIVYMDEIASNNDQPRGNVLTVASDLTITAGSQTQLGSISTTRNCYTVYDPDTQKHLVGYADSNETNRFYVATISGTSFTIGSENIPGIGDQAEGSMQMVYDTASDCIVGVFRERETINNEIQYNLGIFRAEIDGTDNTVEFYAKTLIPGELDIGFVRIEYIPDLETCIIVYSRNVDDNIYYRYIKTNADDHFDIGDRVLIDTSKNGSLSMISVIYDPDEDSVLITYRLSEESGDDLGTRVFKQNVSNMTGENFIGVSDGAYSDGDTATIQIVGATDDAQSGLTTAQKYYVQGDNSLDTTPDYYNEYAGIALSATKLLVKG